MVSSRWWESRYAAYRLRRYKVTKKPQVDKAKLASELGSGLRKIFTAAASHPTTFALIIMAATKVGEVVNWQISPKLEDATGDISYPRQNFKNASGIFRHKSFRALYNGAEILGAAAVVAPVAQAGFEALKAVATPKPE